MIGDAIGLPVGVFTDIAASTAVVLVRTHVDFAAVGRIGIAICPARFTTYKFALEALAHHVGVGAHAALIAFAAMIDVALEFGFTTVGRVVVTGFITCSTDGGASAGNTLRGTVIVDASGRIFRTIYDGGGGDGKIITQEARARARTQQHCRR